jgi:hypothetical protein
MKARILPLEGKYYGTEIEIDIEKSFPENIVVFKLWNCGNYEPSDRELQEHNITRREWDADKLMLPREDGWGGKTDKPRDVYEICDSHFESQDTYELAQIICNAINSAEKKGQSK